MAFDYEVRDGIAHLSFGRPEKHNALGTRTWPT